MGIRLEVALVQDTLFPWQGGVSGAARGGGESGLDWQTVAAVMDWASRVNGAVAYADSP